MLQLANWIMRGRFNALIAAVFLGAVPLLPIAWLAVPVVALVALRRNAVDVLWPLAGAMTTAIAIQWNNGDVSLVGALLAVVAGALVLANSRSLPLAVLVTALAAAFYLVVLMQMAPGLIDGMQVQVEAFLKLVKESNEPLPWLDEVDPRQMLLQGMGMLTGLLALLGLFLARSLQARLYNPGGFRQEFHQLRMAPAVTLILMSGSFLGEWYPDAMVIVPVLVLPLVMSGLALVHGLAGRKPNNRTPLVMLYVALVIFAGPAFVMLIAAATMDSFIDFRKRIGTARP